MNFPPAVPAGSPGGKFISSSRQPRPRITAPVFMAQLAQTDPQLYVALLVGIVGSIVLHELGHAIVATWEGDPTPKMLGHLTWDPRVHMGWFSLALVAFVGVGFGATPVRPRNFRHRRWGEVLVSLAGPVVNLVLGVVCAVIFGFASRYVGGGGEPQILHLFWFFAATLNFALFLFNMLPLPPFDGFSVLTRAFHAPEFESFMRRMQPWPMLGAFVLVMQVDLFGWCAKAAGFIGGIVLLLLP